VGAALMAAAGVAWAVYSLRGRRAADPVATTADNFLRTVPAAALMVGVVIGARAAHVTAGGVALAVASGAIASGVGYSLWYAALGGLTRAQAAIVQLAVPVVAAGAAVPMLGEPVTARLAVATVAILGGVGVAMRARW
jgi:drug/metabolite transporter (DMT)-like permease